MKEEKYMPPDNGDICWQEGAETFSRKEVWYLLYTQRAFFGILQRKSGNLGLGKTGNIFI